MALVFALMGILILSMLAAALLVVTNADALTSFNYKNQIQASYAALAGVHRWQWSCTAAPAISSFFVGLPAFGLW